MSLAAWSWWILGTSSPMTGRPCFFIVDFDIGPRAVVFSMRWGGFRKRDSVGRWEASFKTLKTFIPRGAAPAATRDLRRICGQGLVLRKERFFDHQEGLVQGSVLAGPPTSTDCTIPSTLRTCQGGAQANVEGCAGRPGLKQEVRGPASPALSRVAHYRGSAASAAAQRLSFTRVRPAPSAYGLIRRHGPPDPAESAGLASR